MSEAARSCTAAAGVLLGWERALYSMIFQFCTTQALHALFRRYQHRTLWIVTDLPEQVYAIITARRLELESRRDFLDSLSASLKA